MLKLLKYPVVDCCPPVISNALFDDLQISGIFDRKLQRPTRYLTAEPEAIRERAAVMEDLLGSETLFRAFSKFRDAASDMQYVTRMPDSDPMRILGSLTSFRSLWEAGSALLDQLSRKHKFDYSAFRTELRSFMDRCYVPDFEAQWNLRAFDIERIESVVYDLWIDPDLHIKEIALNSVYGDSFKRAKAVIGRTELEKMEIKGLLQLSSDFGSNLRAPSAKSKLAAAKASGLEESIGGRHYNPVHDPYAMHRINLTINGMLPMVTTEAKQTVFSTFSRMVSEMNELKNELDFFITGAEIIKDLMKKGLKFTFAEIAPRSERRLTAEGIYLPSLAAVDGVQIRKNDVSADDGMILIGGQNRGGKTVYLRSVGAMQVFFQMGLPVPAKNAVLSPVPAILCVFTREEDRLKGLGKIGQELSDVRSAVADACEDAMVLFNEPITATSPIECRLLSREVLCMLKVKRVRGVWITHIYPLFDDAADMDRNLEGTRMLFMHANAPDSKFDRFSILPGVPDPDSGARYIFSLPQS